MKRIESFGCGLWSSFLLKSNVVVVGICHQQDFGMMFEVVLPFIFCCTLLIELFLSDMQYVNLLKKLDRQSFR
jgi:hypothetical protein